MPPSPSRRYWLVTLICLLAAGLCAGVAVQADRELPPVVIPYDPLPRW
ncbi:hypothetical protein [Falsiroseomonas sp.]